VKNPDGIVEFGLRLRNLREAKKMSQQALAVDSDIALSTVQRIEQAQIATNIDIVLSLAKALDVSPEELFKKGR